MNSKVDIIKQIKRIYKETIKTPIQREHTVLAYYARKYFGSWNNAIQESGLKANTQVKYKNLSKNDVIKSIKQKAQNLGRTPKKRELLELDFHIKKYFSSWNQALKAADLKVLKRFNYSKNEIKKIIINWNLKHKRPPKRIDFEKDQYLPDPSTIIKQFKKNWSQILLECKIIPNFIFMDKKYRKMSDKKLLTLFKKEYISLTKPGKISFEINRSVGFPSLKYLLDRFDVTWNGLLKLTNLPVELERYTKEKLLNEIKQFYSKYGYPPTISELKKFGNIDRKTFEYHFGTFNIAIVKAKLTPKYPTPEKTSYTKSELLQLYINFSKDINKYIYGATLSDLNNYKFIPNADVFMIRFGGLNDLRKKAGFKQIGPSKRYTKNEIILHLIKIYKKYSGPVSNSFYTTNIKRPALKTICTYFHKTGMKKIWKEIEKIIHK